MIATEAVFMPLYKYIGQLSLFRSGTAYVNVFIATYAIFGCGMFALKIYIGLN